MGDVTTHFSRHEFRLPQDKAEEFGFSETPYPEEWVATRLRPLCMALEVLRDGLGGRPITPISGYRPREYDAARIAAGHKGVSPTSLHNHGLAADIQVAGVAPAKVREVALRLHALKQVTWGGVGLYDDFVHLDLRQILNGPGKLRLWP